MTRAQAKQQQESRHEHGSTMDTCTCTCGLEPTDHNTKYVNNPNNPVCVLGAQSQRPFPGAASEPSVFPEQGVEATDSVSGERCEGRVLGGTAGPPVGSAQTWAPRAEEESAQVRQTGDTGEGKLISTSEESGESPSVDIQLSQEFNFADDLFPSHATKTWKTRAEKCHHNQQYFNPSQAKLRDELIQAQHNDPEI